MKVLKPNDFFCGVSPERAWELFKKMPIRTVLALTVNYLIAVFMFLVYYITFIPRWINEEAEYFTEWYL